MKSLILTASYLWKDTWKRWFEQPGSILARVVITTIMVSISVILLVAFAIQVAKLKTQMQAFGLDNLLVLETVTRVDPAFAINEERFRGLEQYGDLLTVKKLSVSARDPNGNSVAVVSYSNKDLYALRNYLKHGRDTFILSDKYEQGMIIDCEMRQATVRSMALKADARISRVLQGITLFVPESRYKALEALGYTKVYFLKRDKTAPSIEKITDIVNNLLRLDNSNGSQSRRNNVTVTSAADIKKRLSKLEGQQRSMRYIMAGLLGGAIALIYGTLSVLEFRQSMYIAALLRSFGTSRLLLGIRTVIENLIIANLTAFSIVYFLSRYHADIFKALKLQTSVTDIQALYWNEETLWIGIFINLGVIISSIPVFLSMRKPVGKILS